jgi:hypothetical protein
VLQDFFGETIGEIGSTLQNWFDDSIIGDLGGAFTSFGDTLSDIGNEIVSWFEP